MFWFVSAAVVVVLSVLAWWSSGRAKPGGIDRHEPGRDAYYQVIQDQRPTDGGPGFGG